MTVTAQGFEAYCKMPVALGSTILASLPVARWISFPSIGLTACAITKQAAVRWKSALVG